MTSCTLDGSWHGYCHSLVLTLWHVVTWCHSAGQGGTVGTVVFRQLSYAMWFRRGLRHRLLIIWRHCTRVGSHPRVADRLAVGELVATIPGSWVVALVGLDGPPSQSPHRGSHPVVGGIVHTSCRTVHGRWFSILAVIAWQCCLVSAAWRRDSV